MVFRSEVVQVGYGVGFCIFQEKETRVLPNSHCVTSYKTNGWKTQTSKEHKIHRYLDRLTNFLNLFF